MQSGFAANQLVARQFGMAHLFTAVFALGGWRSGLGRISDNSVFWHFRTGQEMLQGGVPRTDPYSFAADGAPWVAQSWLAELLFGVLDRVAGPAGIRIVVGLVCALVAAGAYRLALRLAQDRALAAGLALGAVGASFTLWSARPLMFGIGWLVALLWIVEVPGSRPGRGIRWALPAVMWLWANTHGTFVLGFGYLAFHVVGQWLDGSPPWRGRERRIVVASAFSAALCLVNPYGHRLLTFPFDLLGRSEVLHNVKEWRPPTIGSPQGAIFGAWVLVLMACLVAGRRRATRRDLVVTVPFLVLAVWAQRNIALAPLVGLPVAARVVARQDDESSGPSAALARTMAGALVLLAVLWTVQALAERTFDFRRYPVGAMRFLDEEGLLGRRMVTDDAWAGYVILEWWPRQSVFIDDRYDMYPLALLEDYDTFAGGSARWEDVLDRHGIEVVVWPAEGRVRDLIAADPDWSRRYSERGSEIFVRKEARLTER